MLTRGKTIHSEGREIIRNVIKVCDEEAKEGALKHVLTKANERAASYTGVSTRTITRIRQEGVQAGDVLLSTPGKKRSRPALCVDDFDRNVIANVIKDFYLVQKIVPTSKKLLVALREKIDFPYKVFILLFK